MNRVQIKAESAEHAEAIKASIETTLPILKGAVVVMTEPPMMTLDKVIEQIEGKKA